MNFKLLRISDLVNWGLVCCFLLVIEIVMGFFFLYSPIEDALYLPKSFKEKRKESFLSITGKAISCSSSASIQLPFLLFKLYPCHLRPTEKGNKEFFFLVYKNQKSLPVEISDKVFLAKKGNFFVFSKQPTTLYVELVAKDKEGILCRESFFLEDKKYESSSFVLPIEKKNCTFPKLDPSFEKLIQSKWMGRDLLQKRENLERVVFSSYSCLVKEGSYLVYKDGRWTVIDEILSSCPYPIAYVSKIDTHIHMEMWNEDGTNYFQKMFVKEKDEPASKREKFFQKIILRNNHEISADIGLQRVFLKEGDWLYEKKGKWRHVKRDKNLKDKIHTIYAGSLFEFQKIEEKNAKKVAKGCLYYKYGTKMIEFEEPIQQHKRRKEEK